MPAVKSAATATSILADMAGKVATLRDASLPRVDWPPAGVAAGAGSRRSASAPGNPSLGDLVLEVALSEAEALLDWLQALMQRQPVERDGALIEIGQDMKERRRTEWTGGQIVEAVFDAFDASANKAAFGLALRIRPRTLAYRAGTGAAAGSRLRRKIWLPSNFRIEIGGLTGPAVTKVELPPITVKPATVGVAGRAAASAAAGVLLGPLTLVFSATARDELRKLAADWMSGKLATVPAVVSVELLDAALKKAQARFTFDGCTLLALEESFDTTAAAVRLTLQPASMELKILG